MPGRAARGVPAGGAPNGAEPRAGRRRRGLPGHSTGRPVRARLRLEEARRRHGGRLAEDAADLGQLAVPVAEVVGEHQVAELVERLVRGLVEEAATVVVVEVAVAALDHGA